MRAFSRARVIRLVVRMRSGGEMLDEGKAELQELRSILSLSYGPLGAGAMFQLSPGRGHVTCTSASQRLLSMLRTHSAVGQLLVDSLATHSKTYRDSGLFAGLLTTDLILSGLDLGLPQHQVAMVTSHALSLVTDRLLKEAEKGEKEEEEGWSGVGRRGLDISSHHQLSSLLRCFLATKMAITQLTNSEVDCLTRLLLRSFLLTVPQTPGVSFAVSDRVCIHTSVGRPVSESCLELGLLLEISPGSRDWEDHMTGVGDHMTGVEGGRGRGGVLTALFDVSMSGDLPDEFPRDVQLTFVEEPTAAGASRERWEEEDAFAQTSHKGGKVYFGVSNNGQREDFKATNERRREGDFGASSEGRREGDFGVSGEGHSGGEQREVGYRASSEGWGEAESAVLGQLMRLADHLVEAGVGFVGCRKVVHPLLKDYWRQNGVYVVDRLSDVSIGPVRDLTDAQILGSLSPNISPDSFGVLSSVRHTTVHGKRYVALKGTGGDNHCSLMLSCPTHTVADELSLLCSSALHVLQQCLNSSCVLLGGGCAETLISNFLLEKASEDHPRDFFADLHCSEKTFRVVTRNVARSFQRVAVCLEHHGGSVVSDSSSHHCWFFPPDNWSCPPPGGHSGNTKTAGALGSHRETKTEGDRERDKCFAARGSKEKDNWSCTQRGHSEARTERERMGDKCRFWTRGSEGKDSSAGVCTDNGGRGHWAPKGGKKLGNGQLVSRCSDSETRGITWGGEDTLTSEEEREEEEEVDEGVYGSGKTCGCGCVKLSDLPRTVKWTPLGTDKSSIFVPDFVQQCLLEKKPSAPKESVRPQTSGKFVASRPVFPLVCDPLLPKVRAIETASDLASTLLRISFSKK